MLNWETIIGIRIFLGTDVPLTDIPETKEM